MSIIWVRWMSGTLKKLCSLKRVSKALPSVGWFTNHKARRSSLAPGAICWNQFQKSVVRLISGLEVGCHHCTNWSVRLSLVLNVL